MTTLLCHKTALTQQSFGILSSACRYGRTWGKSPLWTGDPLTSPQDRCFCCGKQNGRAKCKYFCRSHVSLDKALIHSRSKDLVNIKLCTWHSSGQERHVFKQNRWSSYTLVQLTFLGSQGEWRIVRGQEWSYTSGEAVACRCIYSNCLIRSSRDSL